MPEIYSLFKASFSDPSSLCPKLPPTASLPAPQKTTFLLPRVVWQRGHTEGSYVEERILPSTQSKGSLTPFSPSTLRSAETESMPPQDTRMSLQIHQMLPPQEALRWEG